MIPSVSLSVPVRRVEHQLIEVEHREAPAVDELHGVEHRSDQLQFSVTVAVEDAAGHRRRLDARLDEAAADLEGPRRDVGMVERARVGQDGQVDVGRDLFSQRDAEGDHELVDQLAARRRRFVEPVQRPEHRIADVVVDIDHEEAFQPGDPRSRRSPHSMTMSASNSPSAGSTRSAITISATPGNSK